MSMTAVEETIKTIRDYYADQEGITAVYLFGSTTQDRLTPFSDVDVAVLYQWDKLPGIRQKLADQGALSEQLGREVDLVTLNAASPILGRQVLKYGKLLLNRNPRAVNEFFVQTFNAYFDLKYSRREIEANLHNVSIYD